VTQVWEIAGQEVNEGVALRGAQDLIELLIKDRSVGKFGEFPVLILAIREVAANDEGDAALVEFTLCKLVRVTLSRLWGNHQRSILGDLKGTSSEHSGLLVLSHEAWGDTLKSLHLHTVRANTAGKKLIVLLKALFDDVLKES
jgi:hypothetical protein